MTLKTYIWGIRFITLLALAAWAAIVIYIDPSNSGVFGISIFYLAAFFSLSGIFNLFLMFLRRKLLGVETAAGSIGLSFRQGILLAIIAIGILILQSFQALVWWDALLVLAGVFLVELYFLSKS